MSSVKTPVHHYLIQHYQNTFLNTFPPASTPSILSLPPSLSPYPPPPLTPFPPPAPTPLASLILPPRKDPSWPPPIMDLRVDQSQTDQSSPLDLQRKTVLLSHSQHQPLAEGSVLKQLLQSSLNNNNNINKEHDDSDTMTANTDSTDEASINNDNSYINSYETPPYTRTSFTPQLQFNPHPEPLNPQSDLPPYPHPNSNLQLYSHPTPNLQLHSQSNPNLQLLPYPNPNLQIHPHSQPQLQLQSQLVSADLWDYQSIQSLNNQQLDTELEITSYESSNKINIINNYEQYNYTSIEQNEVQSEDKNTNYYQDINENKNGYSINYEHRYYNNYINNYNSNPNPNPNDNSNLNESYDESFDHYVDNESINANGHDYINCHDYKTKDCLINNNHHGENDSNINEPLKDLINYSSTWADCSNKSLTDKSLSATSIGSSEETRDGINGGQLENILNLRDVNEGNEVDEEKIRQTSSVYCYSEPVTSPRLNYEVMGDKVRNFKLIAEKRRHLFGIKYKVYDDSRTGRAMSQFETRD